MKRIALALASTLVLVTALGVCLTLVMDQGMSTMGDCLHMAGRSAMCPMGLGKHLDAWKGALIAQPMNFFTAFLLAVFFAGSFVVLRTLDLARASPKRIWREQRLLAFFLPLRYLFSRGILHSRRYA